MPIDLSPICMLSLINLVITGLWLRDSAGLWSAENNTHTHTHMCTCTYTPHMHRNTVSQILPPFLTPIICKGMTPKSSPCCWQEIIIIIRCLNISPLFTLVQHNTMIHKALYIMLFCVNREYLSHTWYRRDRFYCCTEHSEVFLCI